MSEKTVLVVGGGHRDYQPFRRFGRYSSDQGLLAKPEQVSLLVFTGGSDISPSLYNHEPSRLTFCQPRRDVFELMVFRRALRAGLPMAGICRGAQFLCAMAGGTLYQHVSGHGGSNHGMRTWDGRVIEVTSSHHQMQNPPENAKVLGWSEHNRSDIYITEDDFEVEEPEREIECVHYPNINAVGMQYHPEWMSDHSDGFRFAEELVARFLFGEQEPKVPQIGRF